MNSKVKIRQTRRGLMCIENKRGIQLAQSQSIPDRPLLAPLYRWPGLEHPVGFNTNCNVCIRCHLVFRLHLCLGLFNGPQGYQDNWPYKLYPCHVHIQKRWFIPFNLQLLVLF
jgi:hypothetical protein